MNGDFSRATRPPSWSMLTQSGTSATSRAASYAQLGDLRGLGDVPREEDDASQPEVPGKRPQFDRDLGAVEPRHQEPADLTTE